MWNKNGKLRVLFLLKFRQIEDECGYSSMLQSGLYNSARFVAEMLRDVLGYETKIVTVVDNNQIDREVSQFRPDVVIIEAFWVVPDKFEILCKLHPTVKWLIRNHSRVSFLAGEGIAFDWIFKYIHGHPNVMMASNTVETNEDIMSLLPDREDKRKCILLPNYYPIDKLKRPHAADCDVEVINIGCFGAIRPLKNQMMQAVSAIHFAEKLDLTLKFHINGNRVESNGNQILRNIRNLFQNTKGRHQLVEHDWMSHSDFLDLVRTMDLGLQVSFSETFNIVAADFLSQGTPIVTSPAIFWIDSAYHANPNDCKDIVRKLEIAHSLKDNQKSHEGLRQYNLESVAVWKKQLESI